MLDHTESVLSALRDILNHQGLVIVKAADIDSMGKASTPTMRVRENILTVKGAPGGMQFSLRSSKGTTSMLDIRGRQREKIFCALSILTVVLGPDLRMPAGSLAVAIDEPASSLYARISELLEIFEKRVGNNETPLRREPGGIYRILAEVRFDMPCRYAGAEGIFGWMKNPDPTVFTTQDADKLIEMHQRFFESGERTM